MAILRCGALLMAIGVLAGAFGSHGLQESLSPRMLEVYQTGVFYHLIHSLALVILGFSRLVKVPLSTSRFVPIFFIAGIALFSGSLYALSITEFRRLGMITPIGGIAFVAGWIALACGTLKPNKRKS